MAIQLLRSTQLTLRSSSSRLALVRSPKMEHPDKGSDSRTTDPPPAGVTACGNREVVARVPRQPTALIVRQEQSPSTTLFLQDPVLLDQVLDHPLLVPSDPTRNGQEEAPERLKGERHPGIVAALRSLF